MREVVNGGGIGSTLVSCRCCVLVSCVHPVAILRAVFCTICSLSMFVSDVLGDHMVEGSKRHSLQAVELSQWTQVDFH